VPKVAPELAVTEPEPEEPEQNQQAMVDCSSCGTENPREFIFCGNCGARLKEMGQQTAGLRPEAVAPAPAPAAPARYGKLALIKPDGTEGGEFMLTEAETTIGRGMGQLFDNDSYLSPNHAILKFDQGNLTLLDAESLNGVFVKITQEEQLMNGTIFRIGQELLRFDEIQEPRTLDDGTEVMGSPNPGYRARLSIIVGPGVDGSAFPLMGDEVVLGRERGDILFSDDGYVSGTHAKISLQGDAYYLSDLGSSNGTFIKIDNKRSISSGTFILMGQQLFRVDRF
jgi:pSer/pThr/pTyr-binding forkhead associated (FHA) protein